MSSSSTSISLRSVIIWVLFLQVALLFSRVALLALSNAGVSCLNAISPADLLSPAKELLFSANGAAPRPKGVPYCRRSDKKLTESAPFLPESAWPEASIRHRAQKNGAFGIGIQGLGVQHGH